MSQPVIRLLNIEDNPGDANLLAEMLSDYQLAVAGSLYQLDNASSLAESRAKLGNSEYDIILLDLSLPDSSGIDTVVRVQEMAPNLPIVVMSGNHDERLGIQAVQAGAQDYLVKGDVDGRILSRTIRYSVERMQSKLALQDERNRARDAEHALQVNRSYLLTAQRLARVGYFEMDYMSQTVTWSDEASQIFGLNVEDGLFAPEQIWQFIHPDDLQDVQRQWIKAIQRHENYLEIKCRIMPAEGEIRHVHVQATLQYEPGGEPSRMIGAVQDISDHIAAQQHLQDALDDKLVLLREVHHRVKNNLQAIISLIEIRIDHVIDPYTIQFLREVQEQARTMSLVYEQLYQSDNLAKVEVQPYLDKLVHNLLQAFGQERTINARVSAPEIWLEVGSATPCGLIVNELVTNSLKHAFPSEYTGQPGVEVMLEDMDGFLKLVVADNGIGLPDNLELRQSRSMGLRLARLWAVHQLGGEFLVESNGGSRFTILFQEDRKDIRK